MSSVAALAIDWPLAFIAPLLVVSIVSGSDHPPALKTSFGMLIVIALGMLVGLVFSKLFLRQPPLASLLLVVVFFWIYYLTSKPAGVGSMVLL